MIQVIGESFDAARTILLRDTTIAAGDPAMAQTSFATDWHKWHNIYDKNPVLKKRLVLVGKHLSRCLDLSAPGEIRIISVCAGDGRDILGTLTDHKRRTDVRARLVELDPKLVADGEKTCDALELRNHVEFVNEDATDPNSFRAVAPANIVMMCGMLGLVDLLELPNVVRAIQALCARNGHVVWTRRLDWRNGVQHTKALQKLMAEAGFKPAAVDVTSFGALLFKTPRPSFVVATHRHDGEPIDLPRSDHLFKISDAPLSQ